MRQNQPKRACKRNRLFRGRERLDPFVKADQGKAKKREKGRQDADRDNAAIRMRKL